MRIASKLGVLWLAMLTAVSGQVVVSGNAQISGATLVCTVPTGVPVFSVSGGYISISGCGSKSVMYEASTSLSTLPPATPASTLYSAPFPVPSVTTYYHAICVTLGAYQTNVQSNSAPWICHTASGGTYTGPPSVTCPSSGGVVGSPSNLVMSLGNPATLTITAPPNQTGYTEALMSPEFSGTVDPSAGRCDACSEHVKKITFTVVGTPANQEHDSIWYNSTHGVNAQNGYQCQGYGSGAVIAVDSGNAGGWTTTTIPCSTWTSGTTHTVVESVTDQWSNTACPGGIGCAYYNSMWMDGTTYAMGGTYGNTQGFHSQTGETAWGANIQPDISPTGASAVTAGWTVSSFTMALDYGDESAQTSYTYTATVASPTLSVASGSVAPGTTTTPSDSTSGAVIAYTTDGTTPACQTYTAGSASPILGTGTTMIYRATVNSAGVATSVPPPAIYGPMTIKAIGCKNGLSPSSVVTYAYTLTAPTGTGISACTTSLSGTNYLTADVSATGTCMGVTAANTVLNLNGHTLTYGTASGTVMSGTGLTLTSGSTTATCSTCSFTSAVNGLRIFADNYNTGGYQNLGDTTTATYVNSTTLTLSSASGFSTSNAEWFVASAPVYGVSCDPSVYGTCTALQVYNGTITQGNAADAPGSNAIEINPNAYGGADGPFTYANLTANISAPEAEFIYENDSTGADVITNNTVNDSVTSIYSRDSLPYPIKFDNGGGTQTTPVKLVYDNQILNSPQGGLLCTWQCYAWNNFTNNTTTVQYANGYGMFGGNGATGQGASGSSFTGNTILGASRGIEVEESNITVQQNQINVEDSGTVHDPNHNPVGCEIDGGYGIRTKDFSASLNNVTGELVDSNLITVTTGPCGGQVIRYTQIGTSDGGVISNNNYNLVANTTNGPSSFDSADDAVMNGFTYSGATYNQSGADVSSLFNVYVWFDQATNWTVPGLTSPKVIWYQGNSGSNSSVALTGTGTATCTSVPNAGSTSAITLTYNGASVPCP